MTDFAKDLIESLGQAVEHAKGGQVGAVLHAVEVPDVRSIRAELKLSQQEFSHRFKIPLPTLKGWEQGRRQPDATASAYLSVIAKMPKETQSALSQAQ